jgi:hypothetical protein
MFLKRWQARQEPFWWSVITRKDIENHRTVRNWVARRLRHAFVELLRKKGYAADGSIAILLPKPRFAIAYDIAHIALDFFLTFHFSHSKLLIV